MLKTVYSDVFASIRHCWKENDGFIINRPNGLSVYTFWHFFNSVDLLTPKGIITTQPNACYICPPNVPQYFKSNGPLIHDWIHFDAETAQIWSKCGLCFEKIYYPKPIQFVTDFIEKIEIENFARNNFYKEYINAKFTELFINFARVCNNPSQEIDNKLIERMQNIRFQMLTNPEKNWSVKKLSEQAFLSESYFYSIYKKIFGISPTKDLINNRIKGAKYSLINSQDSVLSIALKYGYKDQYHFSKQFKKEVGLSPTEFRSKNLV